jgi:membrane-associated phospholipid phosphatase
MATYRIGRNPLVREGAPLLGVYWLYSTIRWFLARDSPFEAFQNAYRIVQLEQQLGIFHEPSIQGWLVEKAMIFVQVANTFYTIGYFPIIIGCAVLLYRYDLVRFRTYKLSFLLALGFALFCFSVFPLAPPRMLPEYGFIDTQQVYSDGFYNQKLVLSFYNPYAAMPSLHFGFTLLVGIMAYSLGRKSLRVFGVLYPVVMAAVIITTGHHYFLDVAGGGLVVVLAYGLVKGLPSLVEQPWASPAWVPGPLHFLDRTTAPYGADRVGDQRTRHLSRQDRDFAIEQKLRAAVGTCLFNWRPPL